MWNAFPFFPDPDPSISSCLSHPPMPPNILPPLAFIVVVVIGSISMTQTTVQLESEILPRTNLNPVLMPSDLHVRKISLNISNLICAIEGFWHKVFFKVLFNSNILQILKVFIMRQTIISSCGKPKAFSIRNLKLGDTKPRRLWSEVSPCAAAWLYFCQLCAAPSRFWALGIWNPG